jgi:uncharacterized damage-inducible protein DinB
MPITLSLDELLAYTQEERERWDAWLRTQPASIWQLPVQPSGRFRTVWSLLDHIFVVEQRHLQRLRNEYPLPESTGVAEGHWEELWGSAQKTRQSVIPWVATTDEAQIVIPRIMQLPAGEVAVSPRKVLFHFLIHEIRHWAQLSLVFRQAGLEPPGDHDLIFSTVLS